MNAFIVMILITVLILLTFLLVKYIIGKEKNKHSKKVNAKDKSPTKQNCSELVTEMSDIIAETFNSKWKSEAVNIGLEPYTGIIPIYQSPSNGNRLFIFNADIEDPSSPVVLGRTPGPNQFCIILDPMTSPYNPIIMGPRSFLTMGGINYISGLSNIRLEKSDDTTKLNSNQARFNIYATDFEIHINKIGVNITCRSLSPGGFMQPDPVKTSSGSFNNIVVKAKPKTAGPICSIDITYNFENRKNNPWLFDNIEWKSDLEVVDFDWSAGPGFTKTIKIVDDIIKGFSDFFGSKEDILREQLQGNIKSIRDLITNPILSVLNDETSVLYNDIKTELDYFCQFEYIIKPDDFKNCSEIFTELFPQVVNDFISTIYTDPVVDINNKIKTTIEGDAGKEEICFSETITDVLCTVLRKRPTVCDGAKYTITLDDVKGLDKIVYSGSVNIDTQDEYVSIKSSFNITESIDIIIKDAYAVMYCSCPSGPAGFACSDNSKFRDWFFGYDEVKCEFTYDFSKPIFDLRVSLTNKGEINIDEIIWNNENKPNVKIVETSSSSSLPDWITEQTNNITPTIESDPKFFQLIEFIIEYVVTPHIISTFNNALTQFVEKITVDDEKMKILSDCLKF